MNIKGLLSLAAVIVALIVLCKNGQCRPADTVALLSRSGEMELEAVRSGNDIDFRLAPTRGNGQTLCFKLSRLFPLSLEKPWALRARRFESLSLDVDSAGMRIVCADGIMETKAAVTFQGQLLRLDVRWECIASSPVENASVAVALDLDHDPSTERVTMPHILYNNNPSADPARLVPHFGKETSACLLCEESRFPVPCVNVEWLRDGDPLFVSLFSLPQGDNREWSLGCDRGGGGTRIIIASGILALNGRKDITYGGQCKAVPSDNGYLRLKKGDVLRKSCVIDFGRAERVGWGFRKIISSGYQILRPRAYPVLDLDRVIDLKANALDNRWHSDRKSSGFLCVLPDNYFKRPPYYLFGWTGANLKMAWCSAKLGIEFRDLELVERCRKTVDFYVENSGTLTGGLHRNYYYLESGEWLGSQVDGLDNVISSRAAGEAAANFGKIVRLFRSNDLAVPTGWVDFLRRGADFLMREGSRIEGGIFPVYWKENGTPASDFQSSAGIPCLLALIETFKITGEARYRDEAEDLLERYWRISGDRFNRPFSRSTLDAGCEDKEAGIYFFLAAYELFNLTGDRRYKVWAEVSADWILTYVYFWHTGFKPGTVCDRNNFITTGWPGVSVQNHHLDVFFPAYELYDFGRRTGNEMYRNLGQMIFDARSHGICRRPGEWDHKIPGEQGEQYYQTNYGIDKTYWRGGYHNWNPAWIVCMVLEEALKLKYDPGL